MKPAMMELLKHFEQFHFEELCFFLSLLTRKRVAAGGVEGAVVAAVVPSHLRNP
jgi:hypothetical protein